MTRSVLAATLMATATIANLASAAEPKTLTLEKQEIHDKALGATAATILKPKGWNLESKVTWTPHLIHQVNFVVTVSHPTSGERFQTIPLASFVYIDNFPMRPNTFDTVYSGLWCEPKSPVEFTKLALKKSTTATKNAKIIDTTDLPDVAKQYGKLAATPVNEATKIRIRYDEEGTTYDEDLYVAFGYSTMDTGYGGKMTIFAPIIHTFSLRAKKGELDKATPRMLAIAHSFQTTQDLEVARMKGVSAAMNRHYDALAAIDKVSKQISANNDSMIAMIRSERETRWASEDRASRKFSEYIRGVEGYSDGKNVYTVPSGYSNVWSDSNGTVILSNESGYDPNQTENGSWKMLKTVK